VPIGGPFPTHCEACGGDTRPERFAEQVIDVASALAFLEQLGAPAHLVLHHALVAEAAAELLDFLGSYEAFFDRQTIVLGAAIHDAGKVFHPGEMHAGGHQHELTGKTVLELYGLRQLARFCVTHAGWDDDALALEDLLVALADKLWKGKRVSKLEQRCIKKLAEVSGEAFWDTYLEADEAFERVAGRGVDRLVRSRGS